MTLSKRAISYVQTLKRVASVSTRQVVEILKQENVEVSDAWTDFHDAYAGYVEPIGRDVAVWGLVHLSSQWWTPGTAWIEEEDDGTMIACADAHPVYEYWLRRDGEVRGFSGGIACASFDIKIEQSALLSSLTRGEWTQVVSFGSWTEEKRAKLLSQVSVAPAPEASDKYTKCWHTNDFVVFQRKAGTIVWARCAALAAWSD